MKRFLTVAAAMLALTAMGQVAMRKLEDLTNTNLVCVTDYGPQVVSLTARVTRIEGSTNDWSKTVLNLAALSNNVAGLSSRVTETNELFSAWFSGLQSRTSYWDTAYSWGDWSTAGLATTQQVADAVAGMAAHTNRSDNPHGVTAAQIGALTAEADLAALAALAAYAAYWPKDATASSWFTFVTNSGAITITGYNIGGGADVVIPDYINGWPVTAIGANAFEGSGVTSIGGAGNVVTVGDYAFATCGSLASVLLQHAQTVGSRAFFSCDALTSVSLLQAQTVGDSAFYNCTSLTSVYFDNKAPTIGTEIFGEITPNQVTNYVTNPQATGWGATLGGMPVVRPPLHADAIYQAGELVATTQYVAQALASTCSQTCIRAWMPLTTHSQFGYVDLPAASNSFAVLGPAPLNSFVVRVSVMSAYSGAQYTFSNIVLYAGSHIKPPESQGFTACTTGVFTASNWNLLSPTGYLMRRDDSRMVYGYARRDIVAYSLGMDGNVRLLCWWSPATPAELAAGTNVFSYGSDAQ